MKRNTILLLLLLGLSFNIQAQVEWGLKIGGDFSTVFIEVEPQVEGFFFPKNKSVVLRPAIGVWSNFKLNDFLSVQPELLFGQRAWRLGLDGRSDSISTVINYTHLPIMLRARWKNFGVELGPEISYQWNAYLVENGKRTSRSENPYLRDDEFKLSANMGVYYSIKRLDIGLRSYYQLTPFSSAKITDANGVNLAEEYSRFRGVQFWVGYQLKK